MILQKDNESIFCLSSQLFSFLQFFVFSSVFWRVYWGHLLIAQIFVSMLCYEAKTSYWLIKMYDMHLYEQLSNLGLKAFHTVASGRSNKVDAHLCSRRQSIALHLKCFNSTCSPCREAVVTGEVTFVYIICLILPFIYIFLRNLGRYALIIESSAKWEGCGIMSRDADRHLQ